MKFYNETNCEIVSGSQHTENRNSPTELTGKTAVMSTRIFQKKWGNSFESNSISNKKLFVMNKLPYMYKGIDTDRLMLTKNKLDRIPRINTQWLDLSTVQSTHPT